MGSVGGKTGKKPEDFYRSLSPKTEIKKDFTDEQERKRFVDTMTNTMAKESKPEDRANTIKYGSEYTINEGLAQRAHNMRSFSDYKAGSESANYTQSINRFDENVKEIVDKYKQNGQLTDEDYEEVNRLADAYRKNLAGFYNDTNANNAKYPSWFIAGPANYNVRKNDAIIARERKIYEDNERKIDPDSNIYLDKIKQIMSSAVIKSNDSNALGKLQAKYDKLKAEHDQGIAMNKHWRKFGTMKGFEGISDEMAERLDKRINAGYSWERLPAPSYHLQNETAELRRIQDRINSLQKAKTEPQREYPEVEGVEVIENGDAYRIQLKFPGKPDEETRNVLKSYGFIYSPRFGTWQRQLTENGKRGARYALEELKKRGKTY